MKKTATLILLFTLALSFEVLAQFISITDLNPLEARDYATREKQQAKVFTHAGKQWSILANSTGTHLWQLEGITWIHALNLVTKNSRADYVIDGDVVHILLYSGVSSQFISIVYDHTVANFTYAGEKKQVSEIRLEDGIKVASIDRDNTGRLWLASSGISGHINVRWSDAPYTNWSSPITIASGIREDDIAAIIALPQTNKIGVLWSDQKAKRWGFKTHKDGENPAIWSDDEIPASQSALNTGSGMSDDHISMKVASDGTLYCAVKTGYNTAGLPLIALLVRRPSGEWDNMYEVSDRGTLPILILNETLGKIKVIYTTDTYGGDIVYKESLISNISFCDEYTLIKGNYNYATSIKHNYSKDVIILASNENSVVGVLATDDLSKQGGPQSSSCNLDNVERDFYAYPNPFALQTTVNFTLTKEQDYTLTLFDSNGAKISQVSNKTATEGELNKLIVDATSLARGLYILKLETSDKVRTLKLVHER
ncbi:T9SS type A sorting domain-containing protein [Pontibacter virosus]|uniref:Putative secreted protein (Por secretion system target) n=1 Tax=Pontibacter virosus TaxID=1765052 RepID=A0A2U1ASY5_9BACT|nr:T9SS type A sorting domain-containing protein [Pontibacter virosus]PVY39518.1 putative secreted protein (Por secretion system target) [Pontibacter virosus]